MNNPGSLFWALAFPLVLFLTGILTDIRKNHTVHPVESHNNPQNQANYHQDRTSIQLIIKPEATKHTQNNANANIPPDTYQPESRFPPAHSTGSISNLPHLFKLTPQIAYRPPPGEAHPKLALDKTPF